MRKNARPYLYDYSLQYKNQKLESIWVLNTYPEKSQSYSVDLESMYYPYLLSVNETDTNDYFYVPKPIVPLLVDLAKYEINEPVSLDLEISFQDIAGKAYTEKYRLTFTFDEFKDLKTKMSTKMVGESLEQHCAMQFETIRGALPKTIYFGKLHDNRQSGITKQVYVRIFC